MGTVGAMGAPGNGGAGPGLRVLSDLLRTDKRLFFRNLGKSGLRVSCLGLGECGPHGPEPPGKQGLWEG